MAKSTLVPNSHRARHDARYVMSTKTPRSAFTRPTPMHVNNNKTGRRGARGGAGVARPAAGASPPPHSSVHIRRANDTRPLSATTRHDIRIVTHDTHRCRIGRR
ncbi:hypothetical protein EVAR_83582_1 [Eumeta japonica]|uniref:Uncharacterized protein n=1 Tax=Eumeta variegata TaxID=151549 RepID=A0A4C1UNC7_EUMVA|nr:hypothetical protein EVAR_83582_1 [Eumeta japonica]